MKRQHEYSVRLAPSPRLLLHTEEGIVPYLTPNSLEKWFPPAAVEDVLYLGISVRENFVAPTFKKDSNKPNGYVYEPSGFQVDRWMKDYKMVAVPTYDLIRDARTYKKNDHEIAVSNKQVCMWSQNGRVPLTPDTYADILQRLPAPVHVPLFDMIPLTSKNLHEDDRQKNNPNIKRKLHAIQRTKTWFQHCLQRSNHDIWAPVVVDRDGTTNDQIQELLPLMNANVKGVALVGWQYIDDPSTRREVLKTTREGLRHDDSLLAVLATRSLAQVLDAAREGCVVGTDLPSRWARAHKAFAVDLRSWRKRPKLADATRTVCNKDGCIVLTTKEPKKNAWFSDPSPIDSACPCQACRNHSRSYIYHLICAQELLGEMLLFAHNLQSLLDLFRELNTAISQGKEDEFCRHVQAQLSSSSDDEDDDES